MIMNNRSEPKIDIEFDITCLIRDMWKEYPRIN
jgi:hypothetical protein